MILLTSTNNERVNLVYIKTMKEFEDIRNYKPMHQLLVLFSLIDCFAQHNNHYRKKVTNTDIFCDFLLTYSSEKYKRILQSICPTTMYYQYIKNNENQQKQNTIEINFIPGFLIFVSSDMAQRETNRLLCFLTAEEAKTAKKAHRIVNLLYRLRCKLSHELNRVDIGDIFGEIQETDEPYMASGTEIIDVGQMEKVWRLAIPTNFVYNVAKEAITNYLNIQSENENAFIDVAKRRNLSWYE